MFNLPMFQKLRSQLSRSQQSTKDTSSVSSTEKIEKIDRYMKKLEDRLSTGFNATVSPSTDTVTVNGTNLYWTDNSCTWTSYQPQIFNGTITSVSVTREDVVQSKPEEPMDPMEAAIKREVERLKC